MVPHVASSSHINSKLSGVISYSTKALLERLMTGALKLGIRNARLVWTSMGDWKLPLQVLLQYEHPWNFANSPVSQLRLPQLRGPFSSVRPYWNAASPHTCPGAFFFGINAQSCSSSCGIGHFSLCLHGGVCESFSLSATVGTAIAVEMIKKRRANISLIMMVVNDVEYDGHALCYYVGRSSIRGLWYRSTGNPSRLLKPEKKHQICIRHRSVGNCYLICIKYTCIYHVPLQYAV